MHLVAVKPIQEMCDRKSQMPRRKLGIRLLRSLLMKCGESALNEEVACLRLILQVASDTNYKIRMEGALFFKDYFS